ncbi:MarR family winged helix-turn-helix transcriptional regulator [Paenibacillus humicola]|uniref:MarR family winged helix-turn-helix transcriptional regulator n=1 Tax=Paenibacillus humicola TaxID=3110540 RepID=UPI00237A338A|nr:MarR family winged helix-turn-helix transcriptional regulator [Paenibacillus humicola]
MPPDRDITEALIRAIRQLGRLLRHNMKPIEGCTPAESIMLYVVRRTTEHKPEGVKASELSNFMRVASPTVTQSLNVLEARGLLERTSDPGDRRVVLVRLTPEGRRLTEIAEHELHRDMQDLIGYLGTDRTVQLTELLTDVYRFLDAKDGKSDPCMKPEPKPNE